MFDDVVQLLTQRMSDPAGGLAIPTRTDLPDAITAPLVQLVELPGAARHRPWNGPPLTDAYDVDVIVFGDRFITDAVGVAKDRAMRVRDWCNDFTHPRVTVTAYQRPRRLPDYNPNLLRFGLTISVLQRRVDA